MTTPPPFVRTGADHVDILVRVTPNASRDAIEGPETRDDGQTRLKVRVRAIAEKGKANRAVIALLAKALGLPKSALTVAAGETARDKTLRTEPRDGIHASLAQLSASSR